MNLHHIRYAEEEESEKQRKGDKNKYIRYRNVPGLVRDEDSDDEQDNDPSPKKIDY